MEHYLEACLDLRGYRKNFNFCLTKGATGGITTQEGAGSCSSLHFLFLHACVHSVECLGLMLAIIPHFSSILVIDTGSHNQI